MNEIVCQNMCIDFPIFEKVLIKKNRFQKKYSIPSVSALDCINLSIDKGERVGLLGRNGSGKTTLLRTLAGVYAPQKGTININSSVTSLFEAAVGMDQNANGYQNIPLLMALRQIPLSKYNEVVADVEEFTELGKALHRPVRTYSQGMRLRLSFTIATFKQDNEIILIDEIMGAGDKKFKFKSKKRIDNLIGKAGTLVLASHSIDVLKTYCSRGILFKKGKIIFDGCIDEAIAIEN